MVTTTAELTVQAAILARASDNRDGDSNSVLSQVEKGRATADRLAWNVAVVHDQDDGYSASRFAKRARKGWLALRADIESGKVSAVIMRTASRGSRTMSDWTDFLDLARDKRLMIHIIQDKRTFDAANFRDRKSLLEAGAEAEAFSDELSETIKDGVQEFMKDGKAWSVMPLGYRKVRAENGKATGEAVIVEADAQRVQRLFEMVDEGHSINAACKETGIYRQQALVLLRKSAYIAKRKVGDEWVSCMWPAIVPEDMFWRVQARLATNKGAGKRPGAYRSLLAHYAVCGKCGGEVMTEQRYHGAWKKGVKRDPDAPRYRVYKCTKDGCFAIAAEGADKDALYMAAGALMAPGKLEQYLPSDDSLATAQAEVDRLQAELDAWLEADISPRAYKAKEDKYLPQIEAAKARAEAARMAASPALRPLAEFAVLDFPEIWQRADGAFRALEKMPVAAQRDLLRSVFDVRLYPRKLADELGVSQVEVTERERPEASENAA